MGEVTKLVMESPPDSWIWQLTGNGRTIARGVAKTKAAANAAADKALAELTTQPKK